jgi:acetyl-CoA carboxylase biotin carboxyl carrier protein
VAPPSWFDCCNSTGPIDAPKHHWQSDVNNVGNGQHHREAKLAEVKILSEIPGKVVSVEVGAGDSIDEDDALVILESMKMEIPVDCPEDGTVVKIMVSVDDMVEEGDEIAIIAT